MSNVRQSISDRLALAPPWAFSAWCMVAAFGTYFCMYAFRKPFSAGTYEELAWAGIGLKTVLVAAQVAGYTLSKFIGIKVISEMPASRRAVNILLLIGLAELALLLFALVPIPWKPLMLFLNGLPLGMVFGLVLAFLEGRRMTEALAAGLCASFIVSSGVVKSVGVHLVVDWRISEFNMPFVTGLLFIGPLLLFVEMLALIPPPSIADVEQRSQRTPMHRLQRRAFFRRHAAGLIGLLGLYTLLTVMRSMRDDFGVEIWRELGVSGTPSVFAWSETLIMVGVIVINGTAIGIRSNRLALLGSLLMSGLGYLLVLFSLAAMWQGGLSPFAFMVILGLGMYVPYVAFHTTIFERLIATFREQGNIGYLMYLADSVGYLGFIVVMIVRETSSEDIQILPLFLVTSLAIAAVSLVVVMWLMSHYFRRLSSLESQPIAYAES